MPFFPSQLILAIAWWEAFLVVLLGGVEHSIIPTELLRLYFYIDHSRGLFIDSKLLHPKAGGPSFYMHIHALFNLLVPFNMLCRVPLERRIVKQLSTILYGERQINILYLLSSKLQSS